MHMRLNIFVLYNEVLLRVYEITLGANIIRKYV